MSLTGLATGLVGFEPTYSLRAPYRSEASPMFVHVPGLLIASPIILFLVQSELVASGRADLHRRRGVAGAFLGAALVVVEFATAIVSGQRNVAAGNAAGAVAFLATPFGDM